MQPLKNNELLKHTTWIHFRNILSERSQTMKSVYWLVPFV